MDLLKATPYFAIRRNSPAGGLQVGFNLWLDQLLTLPWTRYRCQHLCPQTKIVAPPSGHLKMIFQISLLTTGIGHGPQERADTAIRKPLDETQRSQPPHLHFKVGGRSLAASAVRLVGSKACEMLALGLSQKIRDEELECINLLRLPLLLGLNRLKLKFPAARSFCPRNERCQPGYKREK